MGHKKKIKKFYSKLESWKNYRKPKQIKYTGFELLFGSRGVGKSTVMAKTYYRWLLNKLKGDPKEHRYFYSNIKFKFTTEDYHYLDLNKYYITDYIYPSPKALEYHCCTDPTKRKLPQTPFKIYEDSIIQLDELGILYHSRSYSSTQQELINLCKVIRHFNIYFQCCSQQYDIDKALRQTTSEMRLMTKILNFNISRKINKFIAINDDKDENGSADQQIMDKIEFASIFEKNSISITFIPFWTDLFDSFG